MLTPQDIREKTFEKAMFNGYEMSAVDDFLDELSNDLAALQKENAVLKGKMKVLVDKIEEYRSSEDALRMAILSAQKMGNMIEKEAKENSAKMTAEASAEAERITKEAALEVDVEKARLEQAKRESVQFIENMKLLCNKQQDFLSRLQETDFIKEAKAAAKAAPVVEVPVVEAPVVEDEETVVIHETVKSIEETVAKAASEPILDVQPDISVMVAEDDSPTRAFDIVSANVEKAVSDHTVRFDFGN